MMTQLPTTARKDVSPTELQLRKQDRQARNLRYFEVLVLVIVVLIQLFILTRVLENSNYNKRNIDTHSASAEAHRTDNERVHTSIETLICNVILPRPTVTEEEKRVCAEISKKNAAKQTGAQ